MEIKIQCGCGTRYKFDVEPLNNKMPTAVQCPSCGIDGTPDANAIISKSAGGAGAVRVVVPVESKPAIRIEGAHLAAAPAQTFSATANDNRNLPLLQRTSFFVRERAGILKLTDVYDILDPIGGQT